MKKMNKKGFTVVELVIVIAVIAVLAAVLIPTFAGIIHKADVSNDTQLVKNLNTALAADTTKNVTMTDALDAAAEFGYDIAKINNTHVEENEIIWDSVNNVFCYLNDDKIEYIPNFEPKETVLDYQYWVITDNIPATQKYSIYLYKAALTEQEYTITVGFDAGEEDTSAVTIKYDRADNAAAQEVAIRMNGGNLNVSALNDTVKKFGDAESVNIEKVAMASFHEYGKTQFTKIEKGNYVVESTGYTNAIVNAAVNEADVKISTDRAIGGADIPEYKISELEIPEGATEEQKQAAVNAYIENIKAGATKFAGGEGTEENPYLIENAEQLMNITEYYEKGYNYFKVKDGVSDIDCSGWVSVKLNGSFDGNGVTLNNLDKGLFSEVVGESVDISNMILNCNISVSSGVGAVVYDSTTTNLTIDSVDVHGTIIGANWVTPYVEFGPGPEYAWNLTIKNCVSDATLVAISASASGFVGHPYDDVSNPAAGATAVEGESMITIIDSAFVGNMSATGTKTQSGNFKYFTINGNVNRVTTYYSEAFIKKLGFNPEGNLYNAPADNEKENIAIVNNEDGSKTFYCGNSGYNVVDYYIYKDHQSLLDTTAQSTLPSEIGKVFEITKVTGATKAVISLQIAPNDANNYGGYLGTYMSEEIDISTVDAGEIFNSSEIKYFAINVNSGVTDSTGLNGNIFNIVNDYYGVNAHNGASVKIVQFDANGNVKNITSVQIAAPHAAE